MGETIALLGKNGVGKSTLLRIIAKISSPDKGKIIFLNNNILNSQSSARKGIYYCGHAPGVYPSLTAEENLYYFCLFHDCHPSADLIRSTLKEFDLGNAIGKQVKVFSQGMMQRLKLAFIELIDWKLLLIDEPFNGLDISGIEFVREKITTWQNGNRIILFVDHQLDRAIDISTRVLLMENGKIGLDEKSTSTGLIKKLSEMLH